MLLERELRQTVDLPGHRMYIAEAAATHRPAEDCLPLVKHGGMFQTGAPAQRVSVVARGARRTAQRPTSARIRRRRTETSSPICPCRILATPGRASGSGWNAPAHDPATPPSAMLP